MKLCGVTVLTFILSQTAIVGFYSVGVIDAGFDSTDFNYSDVYNRILYNPHQVSDNVVLISTDTCSRQEIAATIDSLEQACTRVIGIDILFSKSECDFDTSVSHIAQYDNVVFAAMSVEKNSSTVLEKSFFCGHVDHDNIGVVQADVTSLNDVVRTFTFTFSFDNTRYWGFPVAVAKKAFPDICAQFVSETKNSNQEEKAIIYYQDVLFDEIQAGQILSDSSMVDWKSMVKDKIVLVGNLHDTQDMFITPIDKHMNGTRILAYSVETIFSGKHIRNVSHVVIWIIGMVACLLLLLYDSLLKKKLPDTGALIMRLSQIISMVLFLFFGCICFKLWGLYLDFTPILLMLALSVFANDLWCGVAKLVKKLKKQNS